MKKITLLVLSVVLIQKAVGQQQNYNDFEGNKFASFGFTTGVIDSAFQNPKPNNVNTSPVCAKYIRDTSTYDFIRIYPDMKLEDVSPYAFNAVQTPRIKMKLYSTAPVGTLVHLQLGSRSDDNYPSGIHSEYIASTTVQNAWEQITFNYFQSPFGAAVLPTNIDKIVLLFRPNSQARDTIYIDDLTGPAFYNANAGTSQLDDLLGTRLFQNAPNPSTGSTTISFHLGTPGKVTLRVYDLLGNTVCVPVNDKELKAGDHAIAVQTSAIPTGIYFYELKKDGQARTMKMTVSN